MQNTNAIQSVLVVWEDMPQCLEPDEVNGYLAGLLIDEDEFNVKKALQLEALGQDALARMILDKGESLVIMAIAD